MLTRCAEHVQFCALPQPSDDQLLSSVAEGDREAFAMLYDRVAAGVFGVVRRVLRDPSLAEEVAQEVLLEVWRSAPRFDAARGRARTWIFTMAHRRAVDRVRSEQAARDRNDRFAFADQRAPFDTVSEEVENRFEARQVRSALDGLTGTEQSEADTTGAQAEVAITDFSYEPETVEVSTGDTVAWTNEDMFAHTVTDADAEDDGGDFDGELGDLDTVDAQGTTFAQTFDKPGTYEYFCRFHPDMRGTVVVTDE